MSTKLVNLIKRATLSKAVCLVNIKEYLPRMFRAFVRAVERYNKEILQTSPVARVRLDSVLLNAKLTDSFIEEFPDNYRMGLYGRIIFRLCGCQMMIKKLNSKNKPSYIPTVLSESILEQGCTPLFKDDEALEPILFFGFTKDKYGVISNPRIVYYDGAPQWEINESDVMKVFTATPNTSVEVKVKVKTKKKAI